MKTKISNESPNSKLPEVSDCFIITECSMLPADLRKEDVFMRIPEEDGRKAFSESKLYDYFYAINLGTGFLWKIPALNCKVQVVEPKGGEVEFVFKKT